MDPRGLYLGGCSLFGGSYLTLYNIDARLSISAFPSCISTHSDLPVLETIAWNDERYSAERADRTDALNVGLDL